jgi:hypothetical protein
MFLHVADRYNWAGGRLECSATYRFHCSRSAPAVPFVCSRHPAKPIPMPEPTTSKPATPTTLASLWSLSREIVPMLP